MGGHGGLNILPQKRWNVYNFDNREKVRKDEEQAAKEEQLKREQSRKRDSELRLQQLRSARGVDPTSIDVESKPESSNSVVESKSESSNSIKESKSELNSELELELELKSKKHINLFEGIKIFDPIEVVEKVREEEGSKRKKMKKEEVRVVGPEDEKYRLGYGVAGKGVKAPWYAMKPRKAEEEAEAEAEDRDCRRNGKTKNKKTLEELREERLKRETAEKERARALLLQKGGSNGHFRRMKKSAEHFIIQRFEKVDKESVHNAVDMTGAGKTQPLLYAEDLSIPSFQVIVMSANMGCSSCRDKVFRVLSKMTGFKEYTVDVRKKQVIIKGDVSFLWSTQKETT